MTNLNKQILHVFLFDIRNYSPKEINTERHEADLNIILPSLNDFDIKQKNTWIIRFIIWHQHQPRSRNIKGNSNKTQQISVKTQIIFLKTEPQLKF